jgi:predicted PurR-regulated permease PerM
VVWALGIVVFYTAARWTEDYLIIPKVIGHAVELHPLIIIFAVLCGEVMAGALGMLIAIPVAASVKVIIDFTHPEYVHAVAEENRKEKQNG